MHSRTSGAARAGCPVAGLCHRGFVKRGLCCREPDIWWRGGSELAHTADPAHTGPSQDMRPRASFPLCRGLCTPGGHRTGRGRRRGRWRCPGTRRLLPRQCRGHSGGQVGRNASRPCVLRPPRQPEGELRKSKIHNSRSPGQRLFEDLILTAADSLSKPVKRTKHQGKEMPAELGQPRCEGRDRAGPRGSAARGTEPACTPRPPRGSGSHATLS